MIAAVITPTYNEEDNIEKIASEIMDQQKNLPDGWDLYLIVSDSHSTDRTAELTMAMAKNNLKIHYLDVKRRGIGVGIVEGFKYAIEKLHADIIISMDADLSHPPEVIPTMIEKIDQGYDLVIGSRYTKGGSNNYGPYRKLQSYLGNQLIRFLVGVYDVKEFLTSFRALRTELFLKADLNNVPWESKTFVFQPSFVYELFTHKPKYIEVPIRFINRREGRSKMNTARYIIDVLKFALKARLKKSKQFAKFLVVGGTGFIINTTVLLVLDKIFHMTPAIAASIGAEIAIISNFILNNFWTFRSKRVTKDNAVSKFLQFNLSSFGAVLIQYFTISFGEHYISPYLPFTAYAKSELVPYAYYIVAVGIGLIYNYLMYSRVIWRKSHQPATE